MQQRLRLSVVQAILDGRLPMGAPLPSSRELAKVLALSRNTVTADLCRLVDDMREIDPSWEERGEVNMEEEEWVAHKGTTPLREGEGPQEGVVSDQGTAATVGY